MINMAAQDAAWGDTSSVCRSQEHLYVERDVGEICELDSTPIELPEKEAHLGLIQTSDGKSLEL